MEIGLDAVRQASTNQLAREVNDLNSLACALTADAYELVDERGRLPERIEVNARFVGPASCVARFPSAYTLRLHDTI